MTRNLSFSLSEKCDPFVRPSVGYKVIFFIRRNCEYMISVVRIIYSIYRDVASRVKSNSFKIPSVIDEDVKLPYVCDINVCLAVHPKNCRVAFLRNYEGHAL